MCFWMAQPAKDVAFLTTAVASAGFRLLNVHLGKLTKVKATIRGHKACFRSYMCIPVRREPSGPSKLLLIKKVNFRNGFHCKVLVEKRGKFLKPSKELGLSSYWLDLEHV